MLLAALLVTMTAPATFFIGTYTGSSGSRGIYRCTLDTDTGALSAPTLAAEASNPSFLAITPTGDRLYAVHESQPGAVSAYRIDGAELAWLNTQPTQTEGPCHVTVDPSASMVWVAGYGGGAVTCLPIQQNGALGTVSSLIQNDGAGPNRSRQEAPHMHCVQSLSGTEYGVAADLGTDEVLTFRSFSDRQEIRLVSRFRMPAGTGPRHVAVHQSGKWAFVNGELDSTIHVLRIGAHGKFELAQTESTIPADADRSHNSTAEIACNPTGDWVLVSNRGTDTIAVFHVGQAGTLTRTALIQTGVKTPRGFAFDATGKWVIVAGQDSNDLVSLRFDAATGSLTRPIGRASVGAPVCIIFRPQRRMTDGL